MEAACWHADVGATVVLAGSVFPSRAAQLDPESIVRRLPTIRGVHNHVPDDLRTAVDFLNRFRSRLIAAGAHVVLESVAEIPQILLEIEQRAGRGELRLPISARCSLCN